MSALTAEVLRFKDRALHALRTQWLTSRFLRYRQRRQTDTGYDLSGLLCPGTPNLVSIILPVYNGADLLPAAIESVLAQDHPHWELVIINDGSRDDTAQLAEQYAARDARIRVFHQENRKIPRTLSRGFRLARGEFLTWTSADNRLKPSFLRLMVDCLQRHPSWDLIYANQDLIDEQGQPLRASEFFAEWQQPPGSEHLQLPTQTELLHAGANFVGAAFLYRSRVAHLLGDYSSQRFTVEDYDYWLLCNTLLSVHHADFSESVYEYRFHDNSLTARAKELKISAAREQLLSFDGLRQQLCQTPLTWICERSASLGSSTLHKALCDQLASQGQPVRGRHELSSHASPSQFLPVIYVEIGHSFETLAPPPQTLPSGALTVFLLCDDAPVQSAHQRWDVVAAIGQGSTPKLTDGYQGLLRADSVTTLLRALDIRCRAELLRRFEQHSAASVQTDTLTILIDGDMPIAQLRAIEHSLRLQELSAPSSSEEAAFPQPTEDSTLLAPLRKLEVIVVSRGPGSESALLFAPLTESQIGQVPPTVRRLDVSQVAARWQLPSALAESSGSLLVALDRPLQSRTALQDLWDQFVRNPKLALMLSSQSKQVTAPRSRAFAGRRQPLLQVGGLRSAPGSLFPSTLSELEARSQLQRLGHQVARGPLRKPRTLRILSSQLRAVYEVISQSLQERQ
jgi:hypothetical protein